MVSETLSPLAAELESALEKPNTEPPKFWLSDLTIGLCGDLKFGRTVHSLIHALIRYPNIPPSILTG